MKAHQVSVVILMMASAILFALPESKAQNLVPNPSFEDYSVCPTTWGFITAATPWWRATNASPDYFHVCGSNGWGVPTTGFGFQEPHTGDAFAGEVFLYWGPVTYREYFFAPLNEPLQAGIPYEVGFWVSLTNDFNCPNSEFGAYFSVEEPPFGGGSYQGPLDFVPQFKPEPGFIADTQNWILLTDCVVFDGGELYMTIGNFTPVGEVPSHPDCVPGLDALSYYFIDDVFVIRKTIEELAVELGDTITICEEYTIDPGIPDVEYHWSTGSTDPAITVSSTGNYAVTITRECMYGTDSVYVIIPNAAPVDIGPEEIDVCVTAEFEVNLDPAYEYVWQDGSTSPFYTITTGGLYQVTLDDGCNTSTDAIMVNMVEPPAPFSIDDNPYLCQNEDLTISLNPSLGTFLWQDGSTAPFYYVTAPGEYAVTITNMCGSATGSVDVIAVSPPQVSLGSDTIFCNNQELIISLPYDSQYHTFLWSDNSEEPLFFISQGGVYAVTVTNPCGEDVDSIIVSYQVQPDIALDPDTMLCSLSNGMLLSPGNVPGASYAWQDGSSADTFLVTAPGNYSVTVTSTCGIDSASINIDTIVAIQPFELGDDAVICVGDSIVLSLSIPGATYLWQDSSVVDSLVVKNSGQYHVTASNACGAQVDTIEVSFTAAVPDVNLPDPITLCQGQSVQIESGISGVDYQWSNNTTASFTTITNPGTYYLTVSNSCGIDTDSVQILDGGPLPIIDLGNDVAFCSGDTVAVIPGFSNVYTWLWSNGEITQEIEIISAGELSVIVSNACGSAYDTLLATLLPAVPLFSLGNDTAVCANEIVSLSINVSNVDITWSDGSTNTDLAVSNEGQYFATISNDCGNFADTINILQLPPIPTLDLGNDQSVCPGELIVIDPGIADVDYLWDDGSTATTYSTNQADTIILAISNSCGVSTDTVLVSESTQGPQVDLGADITGCVGDVVTIQSGISGVDYVWQDGSGASSLTTNVSGEVILSVSNNCGVDADTILVDLSGVAPYVDLGPDTMLCDDDVLLLEVNALPLTTVTWQDGSSLETFEVSAEGTYYVTSTNACGEFFDTISVDYAFAPLPFSLGNDTILCPGESITLIAPVTSDEIQWQDGSTGTSVVADLAQEYSLQISNSCGTVADEMTLSYNTDHPVLSLDPLITWCPSDVITVDVQQSFIADYTWSTGDLTSSIDIITPGLYSVTVQTFCATASGQLEVTEDDDCFPKITYFIPNVFSPNGDGINDVFTIAFNNPAEVISMTGEIYDRWGNLLFASNANPFAWDGRRNDQLMNPGVYVYVIKVSYLRNGTPVDEKVTGDLTLIR